MQQLAWEIEKGTIYRLLQEDMNYFVLREQGSQVSFEPLTDIASFVKTSNAMAFSFANQSPQFREAAGFIHLQEKIDRNLPRWKCTSCDCVLENSYLIYRVMFVGNQGSAAYMRNDLNDVLLIEKINETQLICSSCGKQLPIEFYGISRGTR